MSPAVRPSQKESSSFLTSYLHHSSMDLSEIFRAVFPGFKARAHGYGFPWGVILYSSRVLQGQSLGDDNYAWHCQLCRHSSACRESRCAGVISGLRAGAHSQYIVGQVVSFYVPPTVFQGRELVPLRGIFERLGAIWTPTPGCRIPWHCTVSGATKSERGGGARVVTLMRGNTTGETPTRP